MDDTRLHFGPAYFGTIFLESDDPCPAPAPPPAAAHAEETSSGGERCTAGGAGGCCEWMRQMVAGRYLKSCDHGHQVAAVLLRSGTPRSLVVHERFDFCPSCGTAL